MPRVKREHPAVVRFKCPKCGARPGKRCKRPSGVVMGQPHSPRHRLYFKGRPYRLIAAEVECTRAMSQHAVIPAPKSRNRTEDLKRLSRAMVTDRISSFSDERLNAHVADGGDILTHYVTSALGADYRVQWHAVTEEENADVCTLAKEWAEYCCELFNDAPGFILQALN